MTREEEIKKAAQAYISGDTLSIQYLMHFENGAGWADEHPNLERLWHDASEEPPGYNYEILCVDILDMNFVCSGVIDLLSNTNWDERRGVVKMWAYISDLLPKGGER